MNLLNRKIRYRDRFYTAEELQGRLEMELERLKVQLAEVERDRNNSSREVVARTYLDMIRQREELFESLS